MTDQDLDFSGFQTERKVDVPPPPKKKSAAAPTQPKPAGKKAKKGKKKKEATKAAPPAGQPAVPEVVDPEPAPVIEPAATSKPAGLPKGPGRSRSGRKKRVNVSLPVELSRRFTERAADEDRYLTDMVLDAYRNHYASLRDEYHADRGEEDLPFRPRRRKAASGRVTHMLYLAAPEAAVIDGSAVEIGLTRSELVSQLLELEMG